MPVYAALRSLGRRGLAQLIERCCELTERLVEGIGALEGAEVLVAPVINQGLVRFTADDGNHDRRTDEVIERVQKSGITWFGGSNWKGRRVMRAPVLSWRTTPKDIDMTIEAVRKALESAWIFAEFWSCVDSLESYIAIRRDDLSYEAPETTSNE